MITVLQGHLVTTSMKTLTVLGLLWQLLHSTHAQVRSYPEPRILPIVDCYSMIYNFPPDPDPICPSGLEHEVTHDAGSGFSQY